MLQQNQFIEKNNDALHASLEALVQESANPLIKTIFSGKSNNASSKGKLNFISVGSKFKTQLSELMVKLERNVSDSCGLKINVNISYQNVSIYLFIVTGYKFHSMHQTK